MASGSTLDYCDLTDIGRRRSNNQDAKAVLAPWSMDQFRRRGWLFVVADGMGAHAAGEMASALAVEHVPLLYEKIAARSPPLALKSSIEQANAEIFARGENAADLRGMGTTCTALAMLPRGALVGHVGDSRAYRVRGGTIEQLTRDHSLAWELEGQRPGGIEDAIPKNIITRSMGPHPQVVVDVEGPFTVAAGDAFLLCSDGLSGQVGDDEIGLITGALPPVEAAAALVGLALVRGAPDNVTVIIARAGEREVSQESTADAAWPLSDEPATAPVKKPPPWRLLVAAAVCLLAALIANPWSGGGPMTAGGPVARAVGDDLAWSLGAVASIVTGLLAIGFAAVAILASIPPDTSGGRVLRPGTRLGQGPYRRYDCSLTAERLEGIIASVESAADGLAPRDRTRLLDAAATSRQLSTASELTAALRATAEAIAIYRSAVEAARSDDTAHG